MALEVLEETANPDTRTVTLSVGDPDDADRAPELYHYAADPPEGWEAEREGEDWPAWCRRHALEMAAVSRPPTPILPTTAETAGEGS